MSVCHRLLNKLSKQVRNGHYFTTLKYSVSSDQIVGEEVGSRSRTDSSAEYDAARMSAWQIHSYGPLDELQLSRSARMPTIRSPNEVLVKVLAASVNPIDVMMVGK